MINIQTTTKRLDREKIIILIDGRGFHKFMYFMIKNHIPSEYGYIQYSYDDKILNSNPIETKEYILSLINKIIKDLNGLTSIKHRSFYMYGQSLGGLFCMIIADKISIEKIMLIAPGCNLAESFWIGESTKEIKEDMINKYKMTLPELKKQWKEISPDFYFKDKGLNTEFFIILSKKDKSIPTPNGKKLINLLKLNNIKFKLLWSQLSHKFTLIKEFLFVKNFRRWILDEE